MNELELELGRREGRELRFNCEANRLNIFEKRYISCMYGVAKASIQYDSHAYI